MGLTVFLDLGCTRFTYPLTIHFLAISTSLNPKFLEEVCYNSLIPKFLIFSKDPGGTLEELQHSVEDFYRESPEGWSCGKMTCTGLGALSSGAVCSLVAGKARFDVGWDGLDVEAKNGSFCSWFI